MSNAQCPMLRWEISIEAINASTLIVSHRMGLFRIESSEVEYEMCNIWPCSRWLPLLAVHKCMIKLMTKVVLRLDLSTDMGGVTWELVDIVPAVGDGLYWDCSTYLGRSSPAMISFWVIRRSGELVWSGRMATAGTPSGVISSGH